MKIVNTLKFQLSAALILSNAFLGGFAASIEDVPILVAVRAHQDVPTIDGHLDEAAWRNAAVSSQFVQIRPDEGAMPSESTTVYVLYGEAALYVAFRAFDSNPNEIVAQLTRRDEDSYSDWVHVAIDSLNDERTAFQFGVNPVGVKRD